MAESVDATVSRVMDQGFAERSELIRQTGIRLNNSATFLQEQAQMGFLNESRLVGALAAGRLEKNALASEILQNRAVSGQPDNAPDGKP
jgi:hypothetical protein